MSKEEKRFVEENANVNDVTNEILEKESLKSKIFKKVKKAAPFAICVIAGVALKAGLDMIFGGSDSGSEDIPEIKTETVDLGDGNTIEVTEF